MQFVGQLCVGIGLRSGSDSSSRGRRRSLAGALPRCVALFATALWASGASAITIQTVQPASGAGADPVWGQGVTINVGATVADALIPAIVALDFVGFRTGDPTVGSPGRTAVYLHVYDAFGITPGGAVDPGALGSLVAVSTNTVNLETAAASTDVSWFFDQPLLAKDATYFYVMADDALAATAGDFSNLVFSSLEVGASNPYAGGQEYLQTGDLGGGPGSRDVFFRVVSSTPVPEPGTALLLGSGLWGLARRSRRG